MSLKALFFAIFAIFVTFLMNYLIFALFFLKISFFKPFLKPLLWLLIAITCCEGLFFANLRLHFLHNFLVNTFAVLLGINFFLFFITMCYNVLILPLNMIEFNPQRRDFIKKIFDFSILITGFMAIMNGFYNALKAPKITNLDIFVKNLREDINIVQICDLHIGTFLGKDFLEKIVLQINALKPDIVAITGDLIDFDASKIAEILSPLNRIKSKFGVFFVPGNHEYYAGIEAVLQNLSRLNLQILSNKSVKVGGINLVGMLDFMGEKMNFYKPDANLALSGIDENLPTILLAHQPKTLRLLSKEQFYKINLALLGHTRRANFSVSLACEIHK